MQGNSRGGSRIFGSLSTDNRIDQIILCTTLTSLFLLPILFAYFDFVEIFNEPKVVTLHLTAEIIAVLWLWQITLREFNARTVRVGEEIWDPSTCQSIKSTRNTRCRR